MAEGRVPTGCATVASCCPSVRSGRLAWLADRGTELAANTYSPTIAEPPDTEYGLASVSTNGRLGGLGGFRPLYDPNFPRQKRHQAINLRPSKAKREAPPGKRLM